MIQKHEKPKIAFIGSVEFSDHCLSEIIQHRGNVVGVLTLDPDYSSRHSDYADLSTRAMEHDIPCYLIKNISSRRSLEILRDLEPDYLFVFGWSQLLPEAILSAAQIGCIGSHPALLPRNRGRHPLIWSLINAEPTGGLTFLYLDAGVDSGDILWQKSFDITPEDDAGTLYKKIQGLASEAIPVLLSDMTEGPLVGRKQDDKQATYLRKRSEEDGVIDWDQPADYIQKLVRALTHPYIGAHSYYSGDKIIIWKTSILDIQNNEVFNMPPGTIFRYENYFPCVATKSEPIQIIEYQTPRNTTLKNGDYLERQL